MIPRFTLYQKNDRPFSLAKVVYKEMNTTFYWIFFYAVSLLVKQYKVNNGAIENFWYNIILRG